MRPRILVFALAVGLLGGGGYLYWTMRTEQQATAQRLEQTQTSLTQSQRTLATLQGEHESLSSEHEALKERSRATDQQVQQLAEASAKLDAQLASLAADRTALQRKLEETKGEKQKVQGQVSALEREIAGKQSEQAELQAQLREVAARAVTPAEMRQLAEMLSAQQDEQTRLTERIEALSHAYEELAQSLPQPGASNMAKGRRAPSKRKMARADASAPAGSASATNSVEPRGSVLPEAGPGPARAAGALPGERRTAALYRQLGDAYLATNRYQEAATMFEQSLDLKDDPEVHTRLAYLYSRILHDPRKAAYHGARASSQDDVTAGLSAASKQDGLPRKSWRLVWRWLTQ